MTAPEFSAEAPALGVLTVPAADYERGLKCSWMGVPVANMTREGLIAFIGQLDLLASTWVPPGKLERGHPGGCLFA